MDKEQDTWRHRLMEHLRGLAQSGERGALADLRRGLQRPPGEEARMYPHVEPWLPSNIGQRQRETAYLTAALFALHPDLGGEGSLGKAFRRLAREKAGRQEKISTAVQRRFVALLNAEEEALEHHLRQAVSLLRSADVRVDWEQLLDDLLQWNHEKHFVQRNWARDFWGWEQGQPATEAETANSSETL